MILINMQRKYWPVGAALIWLSAVLVQLEAHAEDYRSLNDFKAAAINTKSPGVPYVSQAQPSKLAAATAALGACLRVHPEQSHAAGYCELTHVGNNEITLSADILAAVPDEPYPLYLWKYQSTTATVYLAGSIHILRPALYPLPIQYQQAFNQSATLVVEVDANALSPQEMQSKALEYGMLAGNQTLGQILPAALYQRLGQATGEYGLPIEQLAKFKPAFITQQLAVLALMSAGYDPTRGIEMHFTQQAAEKNILQLESIDFQLDLLMNQPMTVQTKMTEETLEQLHTFEALTAKLIAAWFSGDDTATAEAFAEQAGASAETKEFMRQLMDQRNVGMTEKINGYLNTRGSYFVLIGAGHYVGPNNIIALLDKKGVQGQRIYSNQTLEKQVTGTSG